MPYYEMDKSRRGGEDRGRTMMTDPKGIPHVLRTSQMYPLVAMDIFFYFYVPSMATVMGFI